MLEIALTALGDAFLVSLPIDICSVLYVLHVRRETREARQKEAVHRELPLQMPNARPSRFICHEVDSEDPQDAVCCDH